MLGTDYRPVAATEDWSDDEIAILVEDEEVEMAASKRKEQNPEEKKILLEAVLRIRMFLGYPDPLVRPTDPEPDPDHQAKIVEKNLDSYYFVISL
jgi:hypothetical protein